MSTPLVLLTGIDAGALASAMIALQWDVPDAVAVRHEIDVGRQVLTRTVSDASGLVERHQLDLDHACVGCALREDIMPTLVRLADDGRWSAIIAHLPVSADATQVCRVLDHDDTLARLLHVASVVAVVSGPTVRSDLLGDDLLRERGLQTSASDNRGVAEAHAALIEYADAAVIVGGIDSTDRHLVSMLQRPDAMGAVSHLDLDTARIVSARRPHEIAESWVHPARSTAVGLVQTGKAWTIELCSERPFHPQRLLENIGALGGGARRSRGCFWLPTRPDRLEEWDGAGGQLSVGPCDHDEVGPHTRILVTGVDDGRDALQALFHHCLLTDTELAERGTIWECETDGFEPWLGPIRRGGVSATQRTL